MTHNDEFIGQLESYLDEYEGSTPLPEDVRDAIRAELPSTRQRPPWWPARRFLEMNNMAKLGVAAAAVVVAALLGYNYFVAPERRRAGSHGSDTDSACDSPAPQRRRFGAGDVHTDQRRRSRTRRYSVSRGSTITVPAGWSQAGGFRVLRRTRW